jgi:hypothetical protein
MRLRRFALAALVLATTQAVIAADPPMSKSDADAAAAVAMAKARANQSAIAARTKPISYADALKLSKGNGKPIFVSAGAGDCKGICAALRPDFLTCHEITFAGSSQTRWILAVPSKEQASGFVRLEWQVKPSEADVRAEWKKYRHASKSDAREVIDRNEMLAAFALETVGLLGDVEEFIQAPGTVCENGSCQGLMPRLFSRLPIGNATASTVGDDGIVVARFPRIAAGRGRLRQFLANILHRVIPTPPKVAEAAPQSPPAAGIAVVGRPHPLLNIELRYFTNRLQNEGKLTPEEAKAVGRVQYDSTLMDVLAMKVHYSLPLPAPSATAPNPNHPFLLFLWDHRQEILAFIMQIVKLFSP